MKHSLRLFLALSLMLLTTGCFEIRINVELRQDGSGNMDVAYVIVKDLVDGRYGTFEKNDLLPLDEPAIQAWADGFDGVQLISANVTDVTHPGALGDSRITALRRVNYKLSFEDIEVFTFDHIRFAYYPWDEQQLFQFIIEKSIGESAGHGQNPLAEQLMRDKAIHLTVDFPNRVDEHNGDPGEWSEVSWEIPLREVVGGPEKRLAAWAILPAPGRSQWKGWAAAMWYKLTGDSWRDPEQVRRQGIPLLTPVDARP